MIKILYLKLIKAVSVQIHKMPNLDLWFLEIMLILIVWKKMSKIFFLFFENDKKSIMLIE